MKDSISSRQKINYHLPSSDDEDMTDSKLPPKTKGFLCVSADPRRAGQTAAGESFILSIAELKTLLEIQGNMEDQQIWLTTTQTGFPTAEDEVSNPQDLQLGRATARLLHPEISAFIGRLHNEITSQNRPPSPLEFKLPELEKVWGTGDMVMNQDTEDQDAGAQEDTPWEPNPSPLMANHPPRITASNTRIQLLEGSLGHTCPKGEDDLGWVQLQQTSLMWQEMIESFSVITHEGLTTLAHSSRMGWTITSGIWSHLREKWGPTPETLLKIQASCKDQEHLEESNKLTPSRHILLALRQIWDLERMHGLPAVEAPAFFPSASRNEECVWKTRNKTWTHPTTARFPPTPILPQG